MPTLRPTRLEPGALRGQVAPRRLYPRRLDQQPARSAFAARFQGEAWSEAPAGVHPFGDFANPWTISVWAREITVSPATSNYICTQTTAPVDFINCRRTATGHQVRFVQSASRTLELSWAWPRVVDRQWHHLVVRYAPEGSISAGTPLTILRLAAALSVWVDGLRLPSPTDTGSTGSITSSLGPAVQLRVGGCPLSDGIGLTDELAFYASALSDYEILSLADRRGRPVLATGAYHRYRMGDGEPSPAPGDLIDSGSRGLDLGPYVPSGGGGGSSTGPAGAITVSTETP